MFGCLKHSEIMFDFWIFLFVVRVFARLNANTRRGGAQCAASPLPLLGPYRVKEYFNFTRSSATYSTVQYSTVQYNTVQCSAEDGFCALQSIIFHLSALSCPSFPWRSQSLITSFCHFFRSLNRHIRIGIHSLMKLFREKNHFHFLDFWVRYVWSGNQTSIWKLQQNQLTIHVMVIL